jgi:fumarate reductase subunit D
MTDYIFAFNGRMLAMLGVVLVLLLALSFGLGVIYAEYRGAAVAPPKPLPAVVK